jgi:hypothetical protein
MGSCGGSLAGGVIVRANDRTGRRRRISDFYCFLCGCVYREVLTFIFSDSADLIRLRKRCVPNIIPEVLHPNLDPTFKRSD